MKRHIPWLAVLGALAFVAPANAEAAASETITTTLPFPSFPSAAPYVGTYSGTFSASGTVSDSGTVTAEARFGAVPSLPTGVLQTVRTLSGSEGTLTLRCNSRLFPNKPQPDVARNTGSCVVLDATGAYAGLKGSGSLTGKTDFRATPVTITDTFALGEH